MSGYPYQQFPGQQTYPPAKPPSGNPFAEQVNPYAAPQVAGYQPNMAGAGANPFAGLWRQGNILVMHKLAPLPDICLKSNQPATRRLKRNLSWHHPLIFLTIFIHIFVYVIIALILRKTATIQIGLTDEWFARRRQRMLIAWGIALLSVLLFVAGLMLIEQVEWAPVLCIISPLLAIGAAIYGLVACRLVWPKKMTDEYIWLKGVHPEFLNRLEPWMWNV
jgi:hypothetical protein